ncbi:MAG TPA: hypothetical protein VE596_07770 [Gaiellaceae bacterium]|nr:hypothetical protein [Gaiellaceae bacterium]
MRWVGLLALALIAAGCRDAAQNAAANAVKRVARPTGKVDCTSGRTGNFGGGPRATVFVCTVHVGGGVCDRYLARERSRAFTVRLQARRADCILPGS